MDVVVQPSVPWMSLNEQIKESGLFFPVDPGPSVSLILSAARQAQLRYSSPRVDLS
jgi:FAD/FMN-containing dehydrogenase